MALSHPWDLCPREAIALQRQLAGMIDLATPLDGPELVAGCDAGYDAATDRMLAAVVVCRRPSWAVVDSASAARRVEFPYVPGLLSFREAPAVLDAFGRLRVRPQALIVDGQGRAHPRRLGIACHLGLLLDLATVGCAKSRLIGEHAEPGRRRGAHVRLLDAGELIGRVVRTRDDVRPVYVSVGHHIDLDSAVRLVLGTTRGFRLPEPTRQAHILAGQLLRGSRDRPKSKPPADD
jgi:deoxyribonuclease V